MTPSDRDMLTFVSRLAQRRMRFAGQWLTATTFRTDCGKRLEVDGRYVTLTGSYNELGDAARLVEHDKPARWRTVPRLTQHFDPIVLGTLIKH